jgi:pimeloyl-ACP methyl ester carboxylesterase
VPSALVRRLSEDMDIPQCFPGGVTSHVDVGAASLAVETVGTGPCVLLVHGFPHTRLIWRDVAALLATDGFRVAAVDLRGLGDSTRPTAGYDMTTFAADLRAVLDHLGEDAAHIVGIDLGVPVVFALAATHPDRVATLTLVEATVGALHGAEDFFANGPPWWFGFHWAPGGLAEQVVAGAEDEYVRFFLRAGSRRGVPEDVAVAIVESYRGRDSLRCAFEHYRAMPASAEWIAQFALDNRLTMPVLAIGGDTVGEATARQIEGVADDVSSALLPESGHIVCIDEPTRTAELIAAVARRRTKENR